MSDQTQHTTPDEGRPQRRGPRRDLLALAIALTLVLIAGSAGAWYLHRVNSALNNIVRAPEMMPSTHVDASGDPVPAATPKGVGAAPVTFVLMGSDSRGTDQGRSDVLMVAYLSGDRKHAYLVSFPRDMWVTIPGHGQNKINAAYAFGGPSLAIQTLESMLGVRMDHAAVIDFNGFIKLTDVLDGVTVQNKYESNEGGHYFPVGKVTLKGEDALAYVRVRHSLPNGDFDRADRQRTVLTAILDKMLTAGVVANPGKFTSLLDQIASSLTVDEDLTSKRILSLGTSVRFTDGSAIRSLQAPVQGTGTSSGGASIDIVDVTGLKEMAKAMQTDGMEEYYASHK